VHRHDRALNVNQIVLAQMVSPSSNTQFIKAWRLKAP
jgi:hypothetical protein